MIKNHLNGEWNPRYKNTYPILSRLHTLENNQPRDSEILKAGSTNKKSLVLTIKKNIWVFPKIGVPQNGWFIMGNPIKMDDLGVLPF